jgi:hypothetical protein
MFSGSISLDKKRHAPRTIQYHFAGQKASVAGGQNSFLREVTKTGDFFRL